jgi:uncharacterized protein (DUF427 family)
LSRRDDPGGWRWHGQGRPPFAVAPGPGQESVWDYPRPPRVIVDERHVVIRAGELVVADTRRAVRVCETASPPTWYLPAADVRTDLLLPATGASHCEWKGTARYWSVRDGDTVTERCAWSYPEPLPVFAALRDHFAFYPGLLDCAVDGIPVLPQPGRFYAGWVTPELVGPWKGEPGSEGW